MLLKQPGQWCYCSPPIFLASSQTAPRPLSSFDTHARWQPVTQSVRSRRFYRKIGDCEQSTARALRYYWPYCKLINPGNILHLSYQWWRRPLKMATTVTKTKYASSWFITFSEWSWRWVRCQDKASIILILPQPLAQLITLSSTLIIPNITGTSSNNCL